MRYLFIILLLFTFFINGFSYSYKRNIQWENSSSNNLYFKNAILKDNTDILPYYNELFVIDDINASYNVTISEKVFKELSFMESKAIQNKKLINNDIITDIKKGISRNTSYLVVTFLPIRKNPGTGKLEKLTQFTVNIQKTLEKSKSVVKKSITSFSSSSVLSSGNWVKIQIKESGIYKLSYQELVDMEFENPQNIRIYGNGGKMLSKANYDPRPDDLVENAIYFEKGSDNVFNDNDYILFYGQGTINWAYDTVNNFFNHIIHDYSDYSYYYLTSDKGPGKTIQEYTYSGSSNYQTSSYDQLEYHELNDTNLVISGREWYGEIFDLNTLYNFNFYNPNRLVSEPIKIKYNLAARSTSESYFIIKLNDKEIDRPYFSTVDLDGIDTYFALPAENILQTSSGDKDIVVTIEYKKPLPSSSGYLNYITLNIRSNLSFIGPQMHFRDINTAVPGYISQFTLDNANSAIKIWDITDIYNIKEISTSLNNNKITFTDETSELKEFIAFDGTLFYSPEIIGNVEIQNLHKPERIDLLIVTHSDFIDQANRLADFRKNNDKLYVKVVTPEQIYNEFSSGKPDITAIKDYLRMIYKRESSIEKKIKYLLLFGDGSFDNRFSSNTNNTNYILTYQSINSLHKKNSFVSDDFFGMLDDYESEVDGLLDIGIGRFPVQTLTEAEGVVTKVINYSDITNIGDWQNILCFIGDDEDGNLHMIHADKLSKIIEKNYPFYNTQKLLLDAYEQVNTSVGQKYPDVNNAIKERMRKGALIMNYSGHGGELGLTTEQIITTKSILEWDNSPRLPLFFTATCQFSRYDNKHRTSAGEHVLLNPEGGGVALLSTTRVVVSDKNYNLNEAFYSYVFSIDSLSNQYYRIGDIMRLTKVSLGFETNKRNFSLLGDPSLQLKYPKYCINTDSINRINAVFIDDTTLFPDTLKAFSKITICGHVADNSGKLISDFNGIVFPTVFDKFKTIITLSNDNNVPYEFTTQNNIVYKGKVSVNNGKFSFTFIMPKDIMYNYGKGKISYYGYNNNYITSAGYYNKFIIGGTSNTIINDSIGPEILLYMNSENFVNGGITNENPVIIACLTDSSGINTVGNGIGHDLVAILDSNMQNAYILNDYYEADLDNYQKGTVNYKIDNLKSGKHHLKLKVWDVINNSSEESIEFIVAESAEIALEHIFNYPNPFTEKTSFYFEHNQAYNELDILIQIYTISGKLVKTIRTNILPTSFRAGPIEWDGLDDYGDKIGRGVYIYKIRVRSENKQIAEKYEKLVILK